MDFEKVGKSDKKRAVSNVVATLVAQQNTNCSVVF
jgi:hypothetical protein